MPAVALSPAAGAHGELCGILAIRAAQVAKGVARKRILVPESAHGTNPATAAAANYEVDPVPADARGRVDVAAFKAKLGPDVAGTMITNPNTCGLFENDIKELADRDPFGRRLLLLRRRQLNAIVGRVRPGDLGVDAMHINCTRPSRPPMAAAGRVPGRSCSRMPWRPMHRSPYVIHGKDGFDLVEHDAPGTSFGRLKGFHGQMACSSARSPT